MDCLRDTVQQRQCCAEQSTVWFNTCTPLSGCASGGIRLALFSCFLKNKESVALCFAAHGFQFVGAFKHVLGFTSVLCSSTHGYAVCNYVVCTGFGGVTCH